MKASSFIGTTLQEFLKAVVAVVVVVGVGVGMHLLISMRTDRHQINSRVTK